MIIPFLLTGAYTALIATYVIGWLRTKPFEQKELTSEKLSTLAVIVCCRNEEERLPALLDSLKHQISDADEVIFANDHSTDGTQALLEGFCSNYSNTNTFNTLAEGKKNALQEAIGRTESQLIFCTDADCILPQNYLQLIKNYFYAQPCDLLIGPVKLHFSTPLTAIQATEFSSLIAATAGAALINKPIMCNGANLTFTRQCWEEAKNHLQQEELSGDDIFLLHHIKKNRGKIGYLKHADAFVSTQAEPSFSSFFNQRKRWTSKSRAYTDRQTIIAAIIVLSMAIGLVVYALLAIFCSLWIPFLLMLGIKFIVDTLLLIPFLIFSKQQELILYLIPTALIYPFYIAYTALVGLFGSFKWR